MGRMKIILGMMNLQMERIPMEDHPVNKKIVILPSAAERVCLALLALQAVGHCFHSLLIWAHFIVDLHGQS